MSVVPSALICSQKVCDPTDPKDQKMLISIHVHCKHTKFRVSKVRVKVKEKIYFFKVRQLCNKSGNFGIKQKVGEF